MQFIQPLEEMDKFDKKRWETLILGSGSELIQMKVHCVFLWNILYLEETFFALRFLNKSLFTN